VFYSAKSRAGRTKGMGTFIVSAGSWRKEGKGRKKHQPRHSEIRDGQSGTQWRERRAREEQGALPFVKRKGLVEEEESPRGDEGHEQN